MVGKFRRYLRASRHIHLLQKHVLQKQALEKRVLQKSVVKYTIARLRTKKITPRMPTSATARDIAATVFTHFWFKMFGTMAYTFVFFVAYIYLLRFPTFQTITVPVTWLDSVVTFQPWALPAYLSLWLYVSLPPMLMRTPRQIVAYGIRITSLCIFAFVIFYFWPNAVPPANIDWALYPGVAFLKNVDAAGNACPSLHVATAVFSAIWLHWRLRNLGAGGPVQAINIFWCAAIAYSTLATKQHVAIDVFAGTVLGVIGAWATGLRPHAEAIDAAAPAQFA